MRQMIYWSLLVANIVMLSVNVDLIVAEKQGDFTLVTAALSFLAVVILLSIRKRVTVR